MEPVWVALTSHWHKCHAVPFEIEADWVIDWLRKDWFPNKSWLVDAAACTEASEYQSMC